MLLTWEKKTGPCPNSPPSLGTRLVCTFLHATWCHLCSCVQVQNGSRWGWLLHGGRTRSKQSCVKSPIAAEEQAQSWQATLYAYWQASCTSEFLRFFIRRLWRPCPAGATKGEIEQVSWFQVTCSLDSLCLAYKQLLSFVLLFCFCFLRKRSTASPQLFCAAMQTKQCPLQRLPAGVKESWFIRTKGTLFAFQNGLLNEVMSSKSPEKSQWDTSLQLTSCWEKFSLI